MKKKSLFILAIIGIFLIILSTKVNAADDDTEWAPPQITYNGGDFNAPFENCFDDGMLTFCRAHGGHLRSEWGHIPYKLNDDGNDKDEEDKGYIKMTQRLAYVLMNAESNKERQNIIWYLGGNNVTYLNNKINAANNKNEKNSRFKTLNVGPTIPTNDDDMNTKLLKYNNFAVGSSVELTTSDAKVNTIKKDEVEYYKIENVKTNWSGLGQEGHAILKVYGIKEDNTTVELNTYKEEEGNLVACGVEREMGTQTDHKVYIKYNDAKIYKKVEIKLIGKYKEYSGQIAKYIFDEKEYKSINNVTSVPLEVKNGVQTMLRIKTDVKDKSVEVSQKISLSTPRVETHKFLYSVNGKVVNEGPTVNVDTDKEVNASDRYSINYNAADPTVMKGDVLVFCIRYYSVGNGRAKLEPVEDLCGVELTYQKVETEPGTKVVVDPTFINEGKDKGKTKLKITPDNVELGAYGDEKDTFSVYLTYSTNDTFNINSLAALANKIDGNCAYAPVGYEIKGTVFIDNVTQDGKTTKPRDAVYKAGDTPVAGIKVELFDESGACIATTTTNDNGQYTFTRIRARAVWVNSQTGNLEGDINILKKYIVKFTYNGQEYENVEYAKNQANNASYATENDNDRINLNDEFKVINDSNSGTYSLMDNSRKAVNNLEDKFAISAYSGKENRYVDATTNYRECLNLGLAQRNFDLALTNTLENMEVSINGEKQTLQSINGGTISDTLLAQDVYFKSADYNASVQNNPTQIKSADDELSVWVNYKLTVNNESKDNFIGTVNKINFWYNDKFDGFKINGQDYDYNSMEKPTQANGFKGIVINPGENNIYNTADSKLEINISLHLSRDTIASVIEQNNDALKTFETVAEISSYSTKYNGDIYNNGHGIDSPNAGKIDEDSNAGNINIGYYVSNVRTSTDPKMVLNFFNEDDARRSLGIKLTVDDIKRAIHGTVFEDATKHDENNNTRRGDGKNNNNKPVSGVTVELLEVEGINTQQKNVKVLDNETWKQAKTTSDSNGNYTIEGFIPSKNYIIKFTYGDGSTGIYNAQDYKSTIDTTGEDYTNVGVKKEMPNGEENYWYTRTSVKGKSVAKDDDTKMKLKTITNSEAIKLENYKEAASNEAIFKNTATTAKFCAPIRWAGNTETSKDENYGGTNGIQNMNLGLAERPRSELTVNKIVDHITITTADGRTLIDGSQGAINSTSWTDRYVQAIVDENLIYGSTLKITYKYFITNTGEKDYMSSGEVQYSNKGTINKNNYLRKYYDYGEAGQGQQEVTTQANTIIDYTDNGLIYDENMLANPAEDANSKNSVYWRLSTDDEKNILDNDTKNYYNTVNTKLIAKGLDKKLKAGESGTPIYLTLSKVLSSSDDSNKDALTYNNYIEIIKQTNTAGRRSYHTTKYPNNAENNNYTTNAKYDGNRIIGYEIENKKGNSENVLLSDVVNRGTPVIDKMNETGKQLVLSIPGDIGNPKDATKTTLYWEPDSDIDLAGGSVQIVPPFGSQRVIWTIIATISAIILAVGIYLINRKVIKAKNKK